MSPFARFLSPLALAMTAALPAFADISIETAQGPVTLDGPATRIAAYESAAIDTLDALGVPIAGMPSPSYISYLDDVAEAASPIGTLFEPDLEALAMLGPDLIIVGGRSAPKLDAVSRVGPAIDMTVPTDDLIAVAFQRLEGLAKATGTEAKAAEIETALKNKLAQAQSAIAGKGNGLVILTNGPKISAYGAGSRFGWFHDALGLPEAHEGLAVSPHGEAVSFEFISEVNPDWLLVVDRGAAIGQEGEGARQTLDNALVRETTAWTRGQVVFLDAAPIYIAGGGVQSLSHTLDEIISAFGAAS